MSDNTDFTALVEALVRTSIVAADAGCKNPHECGCPVALDVKKAIAALTAHHNRVVEQRDELLAALKHAGTYAHAFSPICKKTTAVDLGFSECETLACCKYKAAIAKGQL